MEPEEDCMDYVTSVSRYYAEELIERGVVPGPILIRALGERILEQSKGGEKVKKQEAQAHLCDIDALLLALRRRERRAKWAHVLRIIGGTILVVSAVVNAVQAWARLYEGDVAGWLNAGGALTCLVALLLLVIFDRPRKNTHGRSNHG